MRAFIETILAQKTVQETIIPTIMFITLCFAGIVVFFGGFIVAGIVFGVAAAKLGGRPMMPEGVVVVKIVASIMVTIYPFLLFDIKTKSVKFFKWGQRLGNWAYGIGIVIISYIAGWTVLANIFATITIFVCIYAFCRWMFLGRPNTLQDGSDFPYLFWERELQEKVSYNGPWKKILHRIDIDKYGDYKMKWKYKITAILISACATVVVMMFFWLNLFGQILKN